MDPKNTILVAVKGLVIHEGKALILRRSPTAPINPGHWEFAGGRLEFGETLHQALLREVAEETGFAATVGPLLFADTDVVAPHRQAVVLCYLASVPAGAVVLSSEHNAYRWVTKSEMLSLVDTRIQGELTRHNAFSHPAVVAAQLQE